MKQYRLYSGAFALACVILSLPCVSQAQVFEPAGVTEVDRRRPSSVENEQATSVQAPVVGVPLDPPGVDSPKALRSLMNAGDQAKTARSTNVALISAAVVVVAVVAYWLFLSLDRHS